MLLAIGVMAAPGVASAGRTFYGWLPYGTDVMPERGVELQTWVYEIDDLGNDHTRESSLWIGPLVGITDQLELALPVEFEWTQSDLSQPSFTMKRFGAELRYRFVTPDPEHAPPVVPLGRIAVKRDIQVRDATIVEGDLVASYQTGRLHTMIDIGGVLTIQPNQTTIELRPGVGVSVAVHGDLRVGAEGYGEFPTSGDASHRWYGIGPDLAWTHGRFWLSAAYLVGILNVTAAPRDLVGSRLLILVMVVVSTAAHADGGGKVTGKVTVTEADGKAGTSVDAIVYVVGFKEDPDTKAAHQTLKQEGRKFVPELVAVTVGETISFPNEDAVMHNVFSQSAARKFDLGSYKKGDPKDMDFPNQGVVDVYCNIHPEMAATILVLPNRRHVRTAADGKFVIEGVPAGSWKVFAYTRRATKPVSVDVTVTAGAETSVDLALARGGEPDHKNKYGEKYKPDSGKTYP